MREVTVRIAREKFAELLDAAERGEKIVILRRGRPVACLGPLTPAGFVSHAELRASLPPARVPSADVVRALRDEEKA